MSVHTARSSGLGLRGLAAHWEIWNAGLALLESVGFGFGIWLALSIAGSAEDPFFVLTGGPEAPAVAAVLFLIGRVWVGRDGRAVPWAPHVSESILLGIFVALLGRGAGWGYEMAAAYVPLPDSMALGLMRGAWRGVALVVPYVFATDRPARRPAA
jgi:hypothetical protein